MRIATRLWLALMAAIVLVLGAGVAARVREERALLLEVTLRDREFFGHALHTALSHEHGSSDPLVEAQAMLDLPLFKAASLDERQVREVKAITEELEELRDRLRRILG